MEMAESAASCDQNHVWCYTNTLAYMLITQVHHKLIFLLYHCCWSNTWIWIWISPIYLKEIYF